MNLPFHDRREQFEPLLQHIEQTRCAINATAAAVVVIQDDQVVTEWYSGFHHAKSGARPVTAGSQFNIYSIRKSHIALALAYAVIDAGLDLDAPVHPFIDGIPMDELEKVTVRDVLTKTKPKFFGPGKVEGEGLAAAIVRKVTGKTIAQLLTENVLEQLHMNQTEWAAVPKESFVCDFTAGDGYASVRIESDEGHERNLYMSAKDLASWGYLYLNNGVVGGRRIIPQDVFDLADKLRAAPGYADKRVMGWYYGNDGAFQAFGATGCHIAVLPKHNCVAVRMYNRYAREHTETLLKCLQRGVH
ncbi:beta-lactamase family protein [Paenibacillus mesophilus]|uniref:serine hydrolase domain-containing protein n=1 Tax=Paenibacillus mesophilus TaxID=2582849 RepID=UPI00110D6BC9|nr:serine hydrolase domain-containing protein [Paenibacillus mesophilus]TMV51505.1 beta-lactamase family protein [Paenibacillus mesophilus]